MTNFFKNFDWSFKSIAKVVGLFFLAMIVLGVVISMLGFALNTIFNSGYNNYDNGYRGQEKMMYDEYAVAEPGMLTMSNVIPPEDGYSTGDTAEDFEIKSYNATIRTYRLDNTCKKITDLKVREDVIFESSNKNDDYCNYSFKVKKDKTEEILKIINDLDPEILDENIQTIKDRIDGYNDQLDIYEKKLAAIEDTLEKAQNAYDEISELATKKEDVESLANIISSKLTLIEKLTTERLNVKEQIDRYTKSKSKEMDRLEYSFFYINVYKDQIFNWNNIKESWRYEMKQLVNNFNEVLQGVTVNLVTYMIRFVQVAVYFFISLFLLKFVWVVTKKVWKK